MELVDKMTGFLHRFGPAWHFYSAIGRPQKRSIERNGVVPDEAATDCGTASGSNEVAGWRTVAQTWLKHALKWGMSVDKPGDRVPRGE